MGASRAIGIKDIENAIRIYYSRIELFNPDIKELFGCSDSKACSLKKAAKEYAAQIGAPSINASGVYTKTAYEAWGLDIDDLETRYKKLQKLNLLGGAHVGTA